MKTNMTSIIILILIGVCVFFISKFLDQREKINELSLELLKKEGERLDAAIRCNEIKRTTLKFCITLLKKLEKHDPITIQDVMKFKID